MLAQAAEAVPTAAESDGGILVFGFWQVMALIAVIAILVGYKMWKNKTMS